MIRKYVFGKPFDTEAVTTEIPVTAGVPGYGKTELEDGFSFTMAMGKQDVVYGLGENIRGINKRGYLYISNASDDPHHTEDKSSLYAAHNFLIVAGEKNVGFFFDYPAVMEFDVGYTDLDTLRISCSEADLALYVIEGDSPYDITKQFRKIIGRSYIPPKFAFGFGQSRWGYKTQEDFFQVADGYRENHLPLDMIYMDIDYMQDYKDFTFNEEHFSDFPEFVAKMKERHIRVIPIIDGGVKIEEGYSIYEEGVKNNYFCKRGDGSDFVAAVWPGYTHFPDFLNPEARRWFGHHYKTLTDAGVEGFWNDMNEPSIFYSREGADHCREVMEKYLSTSEEEYSIMDVQKELFALANNPVDYANFYHNVNGEMVCHEKVHNLFGYYMTRAAGEAMEELEPDRRILFFSRSSYIGMHRYGGVWTGDNASWWSHLLLNLKMLPSLNMCGFLYIGADLGGFNNNTTRDLLLRWLALGVFTPLMRNHTTAETRRQECYQFGDTEDFRHVLGVRYRLLPYIYSEFMKAALTDDLYFKPLSFVYEKDAFASQVEDQLMIGNEIMIAPVYTQNAAGRYVYLPEEMKFVKFLPDGSISEEILSAGHHYVEIALNEVPLFIRKGCCIPVADAAEYVEAVDPDTIQCIGYPGSVYELYDDDGVSREYDLEKNVRVIRM